MSGAQSLLMLGRGESPRLNCNGRELWGVLNSTALTPPIALPIHSLCWCALPSHALPVNMMEWEEDINSQELSPCVHAPSYISPPYCVGQVCQGKEGADRELL